jgi:hypothetical protein
MPRSMLRLPKNLRLVLLELRYRIPDNETQHVSQDALARATGLSEATVSTATRLLAGETVIIKDREILPPNDQFIERTWTSDTGSGRPGYLITMLEPPEVRQRRRVAPPPATSPALEASYESPAAEQLTLWDLADPGAVGSSSDPSSVHGTEGIVMPQSASDLGSLDDPCILLSTCTEQQHAQPMAAAGGENNQGRETTAADAAADRPPEVWSPRTWLAMLNGTPGYTRAQFAQDLELARARGAGVGLIIAARSGGQPLRTQEDLHGARRSSPPPHRRHPQATAGRRPPPGRAPQSAPQPPTPPGASLDDYALAPGSAEDWLRSLRAQRDVPTAAGSGAG